MTWLRNLLTDLCLLATAWVLICLAFTAAWSWWVSYNKRKGARR